MDRKFHLTEFFKSLLSTVYSIYRYTYTYIYYMVFREKIPGTFVSLHYLENLQIETRLTERMANVLVGKQFVRW